MTSRGQLMMYNGGVQTGRGFMDWVNKGKKLHDFVKGNQLISKGANIASSLGLDNYLNQKTGGKYGQATVFAKSKGYGKKRKKTTKKR